MNNTLIFLLAIIWLGGVIGNSSYAIMIVIGAAANGAKFHTTTLANVVGFIKLMMWPVNLLWVVLKILFKDV